MCAVRSQAARRRVEAEEERVSAESVLPVARRIFLATGSLEMRSLARELGIGRATLYRWTSGREALLSDVLAHLGVANLHRCEREVDSPPGAERFVAVHDLHIRRISGNRQLRSFIHAEPQLAHRLLLSAGGRVHRAATDALADFVRRQESRSDWRAPLDAAAFADLVARMSEAFIYGDLIAGTQPDVMTPTLALRLMLGLDGAVQPRGAAT